MKLTMMTFIERLRQPEYTGDNRCMLCTAANVAIAGAGSAFINILISLQLGTTVFVASLVIIYLRGYLVPATPTLTKRYFPDRILRWFDKDVATTMSDEIIEIDPEQVLLNARVVEPCRDDTDLCLSSAFQEAWRERIHTTRAQQPAEDYLATALDVVPEDNRITIDQQNDAFVAHTENTVIGQWGSQAAVIVDVAAASELSERVPDWSDYAPAEIARVLMSLRIFIERCPNCGGPVEVEQEVIESCCRSYDVVASACQDCGARLFEMEWDDIDADNTPKQSNQATQATM